MHLCCPAIIVHAAVLYAPDVPASKFCSVDTSDGERSRVWVWERHAHEHTLSTLKNAGLPVYIVNTHIGLPVNRLRQRRGGGSNGPGQANRYIWRRRQIVRPFVSQIVGQIVSPFVSQSVSQIVSQSVLQTVLLTDLLADQLAT
jgi:hypothetical protein